MCLLAAGYIILLALYPALTGSLKRDGILSVLLGLYICSHPVANVLDVVLFGRYTWRQGSSMAAEVFWWGLNLLVVLAGWFVIYIGMLRFSAK
jgi:hypothetical protein